MIMRFLSTAMLLGLLCASAQAQVLQASHGRWNVYTLEQDDGVVCYTASAPVKTTGTFKKRGQPYLMVTDRGVRADEVSVSSGYPYKTGGEVTLSIGGQEAALISESDIAWAYDLEEGQRLVSQMRDKNEAVVKGVSAKGTTSQDFYRLNGFSAAYDEMKRLCQSN